MSRPHLTEVPLRLFSSHPEGPPFLPWNAGERATALYYKLQRGEEWALVDAGAPPLVPADHQKLLMRLVNEGWSVSGEVHMTFEGDPQAEDPLYERDSATLEVGRKLLPLLDPQNGAPLMEKLATLRAELSRQLGLVLPPLKVRDNLQTDEQRYIFWLREAPVAVGEIYLDRLFAVGTLEQLSAVNGWSTQDPAYRVPAKWIEPQQHEAAEAAGCMIVGPLNVLLTHLQHVVQEHAAEFLGLQDVHRMCERLSLSHPVVVHDFLNDIGKLRFLRKVLQNLLRERVSVRDLVTIMEVAGDHLNEADRPDLVTEYVRMALARQICQDYTNEQGVLHALVLSDTLEQELLQAIQESPGKTFLSLSRDQADRIVNQVRESLEETGDVPVLFCDPTVRQFVKRLLERPFPHLAVLATTEIPRGVQLRVQGQVKPPKAAPPPGPAQKTAKSVWKRKGS